MFLSSPIFIYTNPCRAQLLELKVYQRKTYKTKKAQALTIRHTGLDQPSSHYGKPALITQASCDLNIARSLFEGPVRAAIEQSKCLCYLKHTTKIRKITDMYIFRGK